MASEQRRLSIIDVTSADDSLLDPLSGNPIDHQGSENQEHEDLFYTPNSKNFEDSSTKLEQWEHEPRSNDTSEIGKSKKNTKCNLRKSLAWDSAFFTSAGVLDPEELSSIIEGVEKDERRPLPGIQEDVYKSCDSISTLESDSLTLESVELEGDLFDDVRASIQKSSNKSNLTSANTKVIAPLSRVVGHQTRGSSKKVGVVSHNKASTSKNPSAGMQGLGKTTKKSNSIFSQIPQKPVATRRESSIPKQLKAPGKLIPSSTLSSKRVSLGDLHVKSEKDKAKRIICDRVRSVSKASVIGGSRGTVPKSTLSSKSPSGKSVSTKAKSAISTSSVVRTPSKVASRNKTVPGGSCLSGLTSATMLSASISPASSISDWSSESSSSVSMARPVCNSSRSSIDSSSSRKLLSDKDADQGTNSHIPRSDSSVEGQEAQHTVFISQSARTAPGTVLPPPPMKPSGLRMPSPKIGFFDGVKSSGRTPRGVMQPHSVVPRSLPKHGAGKPSEDQNKAKLGKLQPPRSITSIENNKSNIQKSSHPNSFHQSSDVVITTSSAVQSDISASNTPVGTVKNTSPSHVMEKADYNLHPLKDLNNQENACYDNQVDCLSKQVGLLDINSKIDWSSVDKSNGLDLSSHKELIDCPEKEGSWEGSSTPCLSVSPTSFDMATSTRIPFAIKDSFCNINSAGFTESTVSEVKPINLPVPESIMIENN